MRHTQWRLAVVGLAAILGVWLLAASMASFEFQDGAFFFRLGSNTPSAVPTPDGAPGTPMPAWLKVVFLVLVWVALPVSLAALIFKPHLLKSVLTRAAVMALWGLVIFALVRVANQLAALWGDDFNNVLSENTETGLDPGALPDPSALNFPWWTQWAASLLAVLLGLWVFYKLKHSLSPKAPAYDLETELAAQAGRAVRALHQGAPLANVVLRCYQHMCEVLAVKQRRSSAALTPREFERALQQAGIRDPNISRLSRLFERVRYGAHPVMSEDEKEALSCLEGIEKRYRRSA